MYYTCDGNKSNMRIKSVSKILVITCHIKIHASAVGAPQTKTKENNIFEDSNLFIVFTVSDTDYLF